MIEKLKDHSKEEVLKALDDAGAFGQLLGVVATDQPPTTEEIVSKINEIIDYLNKKEEE